MQPNIYKIMVLANFAAYLVIMALYRLYLHIYHPHDAIFIEVYYITAKVLAGFSLLLTGLMFLVWRKIEKSFDRQEARLKKIIKNG